MSKVFVENNWDQEKLRCALEKTGIENVFQALCEYICDDELGDFLSQYCDDHDCWPDLDED